jgi:hypothetical protein
MLSFFKESSIEVGKDERYPKYFFCHRIDGGTTIVTENRTGRIDIDRQSTARVLTISLSLRIRLTFSLL